MKTVAEFQKALAKLPMHYLCVPFEEMQSVLFQDIFIVNHPDYEPLNFVNGQWEVLQIITYKESMVVIPDPANS